MASVVLVTSMSQCEDSSFAIYHGAKASLDHALQKRGCEASQPVGVPMSFQKLGFDRHWETEQLSEHIVCL